MANAVPLRGYDFSGPVVLLRTLLQERCDALKPISFGPTSKPYRSDEEIMQGG